MKLWIETVFLTAGLITYFVGGFYLMHEAQLAMKTLFGGL